MIAGIIVGTLCAVGFMKVWSRQRRCHGRHGPRGGFAYRLARRIGANPEQQKALQEFFEVTRGAVGQARLRASTVRADLVRALRGDAFDEAAVAAAQDGARAILAELDESLVRALREVHAALGTEQRRQLASLLEHGPRAAC